MNEKYNNLADSKEKSDENLSATMISEIYKSIVKEKNPKLTYQNVWETLTAVDVTSNLKEIPAGRVTLSYLPWADSVNYMNEHYPQHHVKFDDEKHKFYEDGSQEIYCRVSIEDLYKEIWYPVTKSDSKTPLIKAGCFDMNTNKMRAMVKCFALFGLGINVFTGKPYEIGNPAEVEVTDKTLLEIKGSKKQTQSIEKAFKNNKLEDKKTDEMEFGIALQPEIIEKDMPYVPLNLRTSSFKDYCYGLTYRAKNDYRVSPATRIKKLEADIKQESIPMSDFGKSFAKYGVYNERSGIAKWMLVNNQPCIDYCDNQKNWKLEAGPIYEEKGIVLSSTPDGMTMDKKGLIEVKCSAEGRETYSEFPKQYMPQIAGQLMVLKMIDDSLPLEYVDLVNWTPKHTKIWRYKRDTDYEENLATNLSDYMTALLREAPLPKKPVEYGGDMLKNVELIYDEKNGG